MEGMRVADNGDRLCGQVQQPSVGRAGDAGNPALANDPGSLAGKLLRIEQPTTIDQAPPTTALSGLGEACPRCGSYQLGISQGEAMRVREIEVA